MRSLDKEVCELISLCLLQTKFNFSDGMQIISKGLREAANGFFGDEMELSTLLKLSAFLITIILSLSIYRRLFSQ